MTRRAQPSADEAAPGRTHACLLCGGAYFDYEFEARGVPKDSPFRLLRCRACGTGVIDPFVPDDEIGAWYPASYYGKENVRFNPLFETMVRLFRRRRARVIARHAKPGPVLDVGCGRGFLLANLRGLGFSPRGVELNESAAWHARHRLDIPVHVGRFEDADLRDGTYHAVIFWHSLEHFSRPLEALQRAHRLLKPGGLLVVAVPNSESLQARWLGADWFHLDIPRHYFHFGASGLDRLLARLGFAVVQSDHFSFEQNPYGWLQSLYNAIGLEFNFFYNFLKNRTSRATPLKRHPAQALVILALLPVLLPLSLALTVLEAALRRGGTVEVYATKR
ncbi:MAG: class I SAM-dependent methyltransferase [Elusimicrobia bacterium]|nr:class I SAM-dependent methyltransferase [Elusimicrobiota bacterium]